MVWLHFNVLVCIFRVNLLWQEDQSAVEYPYVDLPSNSLEHMFIFPPFRVFGFYLVSEILSKDHLDMLVIWFW